MKYRVWDKNKKYWVIGYCFVNQEGQLFSFNGKGQLFSFNEGKLQEMSKDEYVIDRAIGKKDKHGKEIFERDIVKIGGFKELVTWDTYFLGFRLQRIIVVWNLITSEEIEIIGHSHN